MAYCSQCGLPIDFDLTSINGYLLSRCQQFLDPISQFLVTFVLLFFCPKRFFRKFYKGEEPVDLSVLWKKNKNTWQYKAWRRPMSPIGYLFAGSILFGISGSLLGFSRPIKGILAKLFSHIGVSVNSVVFDTTFAIFMEIVLLIFLFVLLHLYKSILGIKQARIGEFFEYYSYTSVQFIMCCLLATLASVFLIESELYLLVYPLFSLMYFLVIPLFVLPNEFEVEWWRIVTSYLMVFVLKTLILLTFSILWVYLYPGILAIKF